MAIQQIVPISVILQGDGAATVFTFALGSLYNAGPSPKNAFAAAGVPPSSVVANNPPVPVTSVTVDANGNITITLTSFLANGVTATFELDLAYNSGAAVSVSPAQAMAVREVKDSGRTYVTFVLDQVAAPGAEALQSMAINKAGTGSTATSYTVTAGKTLRIQSVSGMVTAPGAVADAKIRLRSAATVLATSPILCAMYGQALKNTSIVVDPTYPDGLEIAAGQQLGISAISPLGGGIVTTTVVGFEY